MIKPQHELLNYHTLPVQAPGRSSNHRCRSWVDAVDKVGDEVVDALICVCGWIERRSSPGSDEIVLAIDGLPTNAVRRDRPPTGSLAAARFDLQAS
jgi:hypothetical protein